MSPRRHAPRQLRYRVAFFVTGLVALSLVVTLPFSVKTVVDDILGMIPGVAPEVRSQGVDERKLARVEAIINSMTAQERRRPDVLNGRRRKRVARGSGTSVQEVNQLLRQYGEMKRMMKAMTGKDAMRKLSARFGGKMKLPS